MPITTPAYRLTLDGQDITAKFQGRLVRLSLRDCRGMEADQLSLEIDDTDGLIALPPHWAVLRLALGFGASLIEKGAFVVDDVGHSGPPDRVVIQARSADFRDSLKEPQERSWHGETIGSLVDWIAGDHNMAPAVSPDLAAIALPHLDQTNESDANLLTRLAERYDAIATVKAERLIFVRKGRGLSAGGTPLPPATIRRRDGDSHRYQEADRESRYTGVRCFWDDKRLGRRQEAMVGATGCVRTLKEPFPTEAEARDAASCEWTRIRRNVASLELTLAMGRPDLIPEQPANLEGWKAQINDQDWLIAEVNHDLGERGLTTSLTLEVRAAA